MNIFILWFCHGERLFPSKHIGAERAHREGTQLLILCVLSYVSGANDGILISSLMHGDSTNGNGKI